MINLSTLHHYSKAIIVSGILQRNEKTKKDKTGINLVDVAYRRAKAVKAAKKAADAGKIIRKEGKKTKRPTKVSQSRTEEMRELFKSDMSEEKRKRTHSAGGKKKSSFKSKSRYGNLKYKFLLVLPLSIEHTAIDSL